MTAIRLDRHCVDALKPRRIACGVRGRDPDGSAPASCPPGACYSIRVQRAGRRNWMIIGRIRDMDAEDARSRARSMLLATRDRVEASSGAARCPPFENVAEEVLRRYDRIWKPSSPGANPVYYRNNILPRFLGRTIGAIGESDVGQWFAFPTICCSRRAVSRRSS